MRKKKHVIGFLFGIALTLAGLTSVAIAQTTAPKGNGKIAFVRQQNETSGIAVMNPDGSGRAQLTFNQIMCPPPNRPPGWGCDVDQRDFSPAWSPDGIQIAFIRSVPVPNFRNDAEVFVMNADGSNQRRVTLLGDVYVFSRPAWSPDGTKLAFVGPHIGDYYAQVYVMNADGSGQRPVGRGVDPAWSPDGSKLAFTYGGLHLMNPDGGGRTQITAPKNPAFDYDWGPVWSPDGTRILFNRSVGCDWDGACESITIWTVNADGSNPAKLSDIQADGRLDWSPDGTKIVLSANGDLFTMEAAGSNVTNITNSPNEGEWLPSWQSLAPAACLNPIDCADFFVRQHYLDFLMREPDPLAAQWVNLINSCPPGHITCDRVHVSSAFFRSPEFQERGYFVYRFYSVSFGRKPDFAEFMPDLARVSGFLSPAELEAAKLAFISDFMARPGFVSRYNGLSNTQYVDTLLSTAGVTLSNRQALIDALNAGTKTRAQVLREIVESTEVFNKYFNQAFVVMQYFGYLRRDPDALYLNWIQVLDANPADSRQMVSGFVNSLEYRARFGP